MEDVNLIAADENELMIQIDSSSKTKSVTKKKRFAHVMYTCFPENPTMNSAPNMRHREVCEWQQAYYQ